MDSLLWRRRPRKNQVRPFKVDFGDQGKVKETEKRTSGSNLRLTVWNQRAPESPNKGRLRQSSGLCSCTNQQCKAFSLSISLSLHLSLSLSLCISLSRSLSLSFSGHRLFLLPYSSFARKNFTKFQAAKAGTLTP